MKTYKSTLELISLVKEPTDIKRIKITGAGSAAKHIKSFYTGDIELYESFFLLLMNNAHNTTGYVKISQGGITGTLVDVRLVAKYCIEALAPRVIIAHNHPSGSLNPSQADRDITKKLVKALGYFDVKVVDHIIVTKDSHYSFTDHNEDSI